MLRTLGHRLQMLVVRVLRASLGLLHDEARGRATAWIGRRLILNIPAYRNRIQDNLRRIYPDMPAAERNALTAQIAGKSTRNMFEMVDNDRLVAIQHKIEVIETPGLAALRAAQAEGRGAILIGGHYGRFDAVRAALMHQGIEVGAVYRPQNNPFYSAEMLHHFEKVGKPMLPRGRSGTRQLIKHLRAGGVMAILIDQKIGLGEPIDFLGHPAMTSTDIAALALRYDLPLIPSYALRTTNGTYFRVELEPPVPHTDPTTMTQAVTDSLAARIRSDPTEWYWLHRRWDKPKGKILDRGPVPPPSA